MDDIGNADGTGDENPEGRLETSAVTGQTPPCGPQWLRGLAPLAPRAMAYDKPLCASLGGFTLHAATHAGAADMAGREALLRYVLPPPPDRTASLAAPKQRPTRMQSWRSAARRSARPTAVTRSCLSATTTGPPAQSR